MKTKQIVELDPHEILNAVSLYLQKEKPETYTRIFIAKYNFPIDFIGFKFELFNEDGGEVADEKNSRSEHKRLIRVEDETK